MRVRRWGTEGPCVTRALSAVRAASSKATCSCCRSRLSRRALPARPCSRRRSGSVRCVERNCLFPEGKRQEGKEKRPCVSDRQRWKSRRLARNAERKTSRRIDIRIAAPNCPPPRFRVRRVLLERPAHPVRRRPPAFPERRPLPVRRKRPVCRVNPKTLELGTRVDLGSNSSLGPAWVRVRTLAWIRARVRVGAWARSELGFELEFEPEFGLELELESKFELEL